MIKKLQLFLFLLVFSQLNGQITITNASFPAVGDTLRTAVDAMPSVDILGPGGDQEWNFTNLSGIVQEVLVRDATEGEFFSEFLNAELMFTTVTNVDAGEIYHNITSSVDENLGYVGPDPANFGLNLVARFNPPVPDRRAPMNFFDVNTADTDVVVAFDASVLPPEVTDSFPVSPDSIRFRIAAERLDVVDAWGTLSIPGGTYDVLREKRTEERETRMDVLVGIGPFSEWIDITDIVGLDFLGIDTTITYNFFSNDAKEPIAVVTVDNETEEPRVVTFKSNDFVSSVNYLNTGKSDIFASPNPAITEVRFEFLNLKKGNYKLKVYNILGVEVWNNKYSIINNHRAIRVDLSDFRKGTYLYSLEDDRGKTITTKRLIILKP